MLENSLNNILLNFLTKYSLDKHLCPADIKLSILKGGKSGAGLYQFEINQSHFILRVPPENASILTKAHQSFLTKQAGEAQIGPKVRYIDPKFNGIILDYIPGNEVQAENFSNITLIDKIATVLRNLHQNKRLFPIAVSPFKRFNDFFQKSTEYPIQINKIKLCIDVIEQTLRFYPMIFSPTHLDLHLSNIILTNKEDIFLIDWVNGGMSDPFFDLATFSYFSKLNEVNIEKFLTLYFERPVHEIEKHRFNILFPVRIMVIAISLFSNPLSKKKDYEYYIEESINLIQSQRFKKSLKALQNIALKKAKI